MGRVYLGRSAAGRLVAVKTIRDDYAEEPDFRDRFAHEVAAARRVSGVFTAAVVAADPEAEVPWLATAYVPAPSLSRLVETCGPLPVPAVRWLAAGCAEALESIHAAGLVHRDLKPSNVLVSLDGPQVIDFGVARAVERIQLTATREALGTPAYMAPEQAREARSTGPASDVFSLGSTLLYAATGHAPYQGETTVDVLVRLATQPPDLTPLPAEPVDAADHPSLPGREPEDTVGSRAGEQHPSFPPATQLPGPQVGEGTGGGAHRADPPRRVDRRLAIVLGCLAAVVLVGGGLEIGSRLGNDGSGTAAQQQVDPGPPPGGPGQRPPPPPAGDPAAKPEVSVNQPFGDSRTTFVVSGRGWRPNTTVTLTLDGKPVVPKAPVTD